MAKKNIGVANKAIIKAKGKYLIIKKSDGEDVKPNTYDLPGGRMNYRETPEESLKREVKEESGLDVAVIGVTDVWSFLIEEKNFQLVGITWACTSESQKVTLSPEHSSHHWLSFQEALKSQDKYPKWLVESIKIAEKLLNKESKK